MAEGADLVIAHASELLTCRARSRGAVGADLAGVEVVPDGALAILEGSIVDVGPTDEVLSNWRPSRLFDATGRLVTPGLVDAHTHLVHAGTRADEYAGLLAPDAGRAAPTLAGGIGRTVEATRRAGFDALLAGCQRLLDEALVNGTTTLEAKGGYGLDQESELRLLRVLRAVEHPVDVVVSHLALHVLPPGFAGERAAYLDEVLRTLPKAAELAEYCDVSCDPACFSAAECRLVAEEAARSGLRVRLHADQTGWAGGAELAAELRAASADHLDYASDDGISALAGAGTVGVLVPGVAFHLLEATADRSGAVRKPFLASLVHRMAEAGVCLAVASDYNPGSSPAVSMQSAMRLAARLFRLGYAAVWKMATINAAVALDRAADRGSLERGKRADVVIWRVPSHRDVVHRFGVNLVDAVFTRGVLSAAGGSRLDDQPVR